jgi:hypothetical protein
MDSFGIGQRPVAGSCEHGNEPSGSINCVEFVNQLSVASQEVLGCTE